MSIQPQDLSQLAQWLAAADIDYLELSSPELHARIHRHGATEVGPATPPGLVASMLDEADVLIVRAPSVGVLLDRIPGRAEPLCTLGMAVQPGSLVALLQVGPLLLPVRATCDGSAGNWLVAPGSTVGYGTPLLEIHKESLKTSAQAQGLQDEH